jgi:ribosome-associated translation inhibitor RaiA
MRIEIVEDDSFGPQVRTYAEYRLFAALPQVIDTNQVRRARLVLRRVEHGRHTGAISCDVTLEIRDRDVLRIKATGEHPYAAINRAMERITGERGRRAS